MSVLLLAYPGCIMFEVALVAELLHATPGIELATPSGDPVDSHGLRYHAALTHEAASHRPWDAVVVPGGDPEVLMGDALVHALLGRAHAQGAVVAGICAGALVLADAGLLRGRRATHNYTRECAPEEVVSFAAPYFEGLVYVEDAWALEERVLTAKPEAWVEFGVMLAHQLGVLQEPDAAISYYRRPQGIQEPLLGG